MDEALNHRDEAVPNPAQVLLAIGGMHCANCSRQIERALLAMPGVRAAQVNPATGRASVSWSAASTDLDHIVARIEQLGFTPSRLAAARTMTGAESPVTLERRAALKRLAVAGLGMMQVMMYSVALYAGVFQGMDPAIRRLLELVSLLVATPIVFYSARPFFAAALRGLRERTAVMDLPVALAIGSAYAWSLWVTLGPGLGVVYFDSVVMFTFFLQVARFVEMSVRHSAGERTDALARLLPATVTRVGAAGDESGIPLDAVRPGDLLRVHRGDAIPADGCVEDGVAGVDESVLTGEPLPRTARAADPLSAGTVLSSGSVVMRVERVGDASTVGVLTRLLDQAQVQRPPLRKLGDRVAGGFIGAVLLLAAAVCGVWLMIAPERAFAITLSVLVVTCPCALSLATPAVLAAATSRLARLGVLVTRPQAIENLARLEVMMLDKTGTLTDGELAIEGVTCVREGVTSGSLLAIAAALEAGSAHPLARVFRAYAGPLEAEQTDEFPGQGVCGRIDGIDYRLGRADFAGGVGSVDGDVGGYRGSVWLADAQGPLARIDISDSLRPHTPATIDQLRALGLEVCIASGDCCGAVERLGRTLGLPGDGRQTPQDKLQAIARRQADGSCVGMIGDGINDAAVLAAADLSVAMGSGTDLAKVAADAVLMGETLLPLPQAIVLARRALRVVRQNLAWAIVYNALALPLAAVGLVQPWMAALGMSASSLVVVLNAARVRSMRVSVPPARTGRAAPPVDQSIRT